jgi:hypothetical protein
VEGAWESSGVPLETEKEGKGFFCCAGAREARISRKAAVQRNREHGDSPLKDLNAAFFGWNRIRYA